MLEWIHTDAFHELAAVLALAAVFGAVGLLLRQPLVIAFMAVGIVAGPAVAGVIRSYEQIALLSHVGIALLLFIVGLRLDLHVIRTIGPVALATGLGQIAFTSLLGFVLARAMGMSVLPAAYVAVALTFSSTIIIVKLLSDKQEIDSLHGRIAVGFLIVQDLVALLALAALTTLGGSRATGSLSVAGAVTMGLKAVALLGIAGVVMWLASGRVLHQLARTPELLVLASIAWAVLLGALGEALGFSREVGAFLAGLALASCPYRDAIAGRLSTVRDFLLLFFFIDLGARLDWSTVGAQGVPALAFSLFVLIGNPLIVMVIMGVMGYRRRTGFLAGLTVAQISEFSLILGALGVSLGHIPPQTLGLITVVGVTTIFVSTYLILYSAPLYRVLAGPLRIFERRVPHREAEVTDAAHRPEVEFLVLGLGSYGSRLVEQLLRRGKTLLGVDFDPQVLARWRQRGLAVLYGDAGDPELYERLPLGAVRWFVSTIRSPRLSRTVLRLLAQRGYAGQVALTAATPEEAHAYRGLGVAKVLCPFQDAAEEAADLLSHAPSLPAPLPDWPLTFDEVRLRPGATASDRRLRDIALRSTTGATVVAVVRGGRIFYGPDPDFRFAPGDHVVLAGCPDEVLRARELLTEARGDTGEPEPDIFTMQEMVVAPGSEMDGRTLAELGFRQRYRATVIGIRRAGECRATPGPDERLQDGDRLLVIGPTSDAPATAYGSGRG